jgi:hypothetical protein
MIVLKRSFLYRGIAVEVVTEATTSPDAATHRLQELIKDAVLGIDVAIREGKLFLI